MWDTCSGFSLLALHACLCTVLPFSSIGIAKAALEAINGSNMFGDTGANWSVVFIDIDAHFRNRSTVDTLLPRESASKVTRSLQLYNQCFVLLLDCVSFSFLVVSWIEHSARVCVCRVLGGSVSGQCGSVVVSY